MHTLELVVDTSCPSVIPDGSVTSKIMLMPWNDERWLESGYLRAFQRTSTESYNVVLAIETFYWCLLVPSKHHPTSLPMREGPQPICSSLHHLRIFLLHSNKSPFPTLELSLYSGSDLLAFGVQGAVRGWEAGSRYSWEGVDTYRDDFIHLTKGSGLGVGV